MAAKDTTPEPEPDDIPDDIPDSSKTSGQFPADEVAATFEDEPKK